MAVAHVPRAKMPSAMNPARPQEQSAAEGKQSLPKLQELYMVESYALQELWCTIMGGGG